MFMKAFRNFYTFRDVTFPFRKDSKHLTQAQRTGNYLIFSKEDYKHFLVGRFIRSKKHSPLIKVYAAYRLRKDSNVELFVDFPIQIFEFDLK